MCNTTMCTAYVASSLASCRRTRTGEGRNGHVKCRTSPSEPERCRLRQEAQRRTHRESPLAAGCPEREDSFTWGCEADHNEGAATCMWSFVTTRAARS